ncbi:MAG: hypothetical protein Q8K07_09535 [Methylicorpusculum sp.]|uniref:hypothetical protein n=1 Tax=Methylicorpusculum sp. TaxID=2713644 RepID=UPI00273089F7|nr:hypothetical protein [Methylicorpusculum sp.]MDP2202247.1 hypothetical protein [Methylicorpusculum sp.]
MSEILKKPNKSVKGTHRPLMVLKFGFYQGSVASLKFSERYAPYRNVSPMMMLRFTNHDDFFEMQVHPEEDPSLPSFGDALVSLRVRSSGFVGENQVWVDVEAMRRFVRTLLDLNRVLNGEARLESISPNELSISVDAVSSS